MIKLDMPQPAEVIAKMQRCADCAAQNEHATCTMDYRPLQAWMEQVQDMLTHLAIR